MKELKTALLKFLVSVSAAACILTAGTFPVSAAAAKLVLLKNGKTYTSYDVTGDGKKDKLSYNAAKGTVSVNGKSQKLFAGVTPASKIRVFYYSLNSSNTFILTEYAKSSVCKVSNGYRYSGGRFKKASEPMGAFNSCRIGRLSGTNLILYTSPTSGAALKGFSNVSGKPFEYEETYRVNTTKHMIVRASNYGKLRSAKTFYNGTNKTVKLSKKSKPIDTAGPALTYGQKFSLGRVYFDYTGIDARTGHKVYEIKFEGKTGWLKDTSGVQFVKMDPVADERQDFYKDVLYWTRYTPGSFSGVSAAMKAFMKKAGASSTEKYDGTLWKGSGFEALEYSDGWLGGIEDHQFEFKNTGNKLLSCGGVSIGMTADEAAKAFEKVGKLCNPGSAEEPVRFQRINDGSEVEMHIYVGEITEEEYSIYGSCRDDCLELKLTGGRVSSYEFERVVYYGSDD